MLKFAIFTPCKKGILYSSSSYKKGHVSLFNVKILQKSCTFSWRCDIMKIYSFSLSIVQCDKEDDLWLLHWLNSSKSTSRFAIWVGLKTHRQGPTGIGKTLEDLLGIIENNIDGPDFGDYELKSCRLDSNSMLTIFTKTPQPKGAANTLRMTFGYSSDAYDNDEKVLHSTLSANRYVAIADTGHSLKSFVLWY